MWILKRGVQDEAIMIPLPDKYSLRSTFLFFLTRSDIFVSMVIETTRGSLEGQGPEFKVQHGTITRYRNGCSTRLDERADQSLCILPIC